MVSGLSGVNGAHANPTAENPKAEVVAIHLPCLEDRIVLVIRWRILTVFAMASTAVQMNLIILDVLKKLVDWFLQENICIQTLLLVIALDTVIPSITLLQEHSKSRSHFSYSDVSDGVFLVCHKITSCGAQTKLNFQVYSVPRYFNKFIWRFIWAARLQSCLLFV